MKSVKRNVTPDSAFLRRPKAVSKGGILSSAARAVRDSSKFGCFLTTAVSISALKKALQVEKHELRLFCVLGLLVLLAGCGYRPLLSSGGDAVATVYVKEIENQTAYRDVTPALVTGLRTHLNRYGMAVTDAPSGATCQLTVRVFAIVDETAAIALENKQEVPLKRKWKIQSMVTLESPAGELLMAPTVMKNAVYANSPNAITADNVRVSHASAQLIDGLASRVAKRVAASI